MAAETGTDISRSIGRLEGQTEQMNQRLSRIESQLKRFRAIANQGSDSGGERSKPAPPPPKPQVNPLKPPNAPREVQKGDSPKQGPKSALSRLKQ